MVKRTRRYHLALCLCGTSKCRQTFLDFVASDSTQQLLTRWHSPADRFAMLFDASVSQVGVALHAVVSSRSTASKILWYYRGLQKRTRVWVDYYLYES